MRKHNTTDTQVREILASVLDWMSVKLHDARPVNSEIGLWEVRVAKDYSYPEMVEQIYGALVGDATLMNLMPQPDCYVATLLLPPSFMDYEQ